MCVQVDLIQDLLRAVREKCQSFVPTYSDAVRLFPICSCPVLLPPLYVSRTCLVALQLRVGFAVLRQGKLRLAGHLSWLPRLGFGLTTEFYKKNRALVRKKTWLDNFGRLVALAALSQALFF